MDSGSGVDIDRAVWDETADELGVEWAMEHCPHRVRIYKDPVNQRWQVHWPVLGSRSRIFLAHGGLNKALGKVLRWAWREVLDRPCPLQLAP